MSYVLSSSADHLLVMSTEYQNIPSQQPILARNPKQDLETQITGRLWWVDSFLIFFHPDIALVAANHHWELPISAKSIKVQGDHGGLRPQLH